MWSQIALGSAVVLATTFLHAVGTVIALAVLKKMYRPRESHLQRGVMISALVVGMFHVSLLDATLWAYTYVGVGAIADIEPALYFSMVTFTTLGYGDITLSPDWRLLASFEAANGSIMFGWTTALVVAYMQKLAPSRSDDD